MSFIVFIVILISLLAVLFAMRSKENYGSYAILGANNPYGINELFSSGNVNRCAGGPYMYSSNPYLSAVCQGINSEDVGGCRATGFNRGSNVKFQYTSLANGAWDNALCNNKCFTSLCVL